MEQDVKELREFVSELAEKVTENEEALNDLELRYESKSGRGGDFRDDGFGDFYNMGSRGLFGGGGMASAFRHRGLSGMAFERDMIESIRELQQDSIHASRLVETFDERLSKIEKHLGI